MSNPYGGPAVTPVTSPPTDPVSITGFVLGLLGCSCYLGCTSVIGLVLGVVGLRRTKDGVRQGRWAAVSAIVTGAVGTVLLAGLVAIGTWYWRITIPVEEADVGQCVDLDHPSGPDLITLREQDCAEPHDAEVAATGRFTDEEADKFTSGPPEDVCVEQMSAPYTEAVLSDDLLIGIISEADEPEAGDAFVCYLVRRGGDDLEAPILD